MHPINKVHHLANMEDISKVPHLLNMEGISKVPHLLNMEDISNRISRHLSMLNLNQTRLTMLLQALLQRSWGYSC
jgi:hypothetical protein